MLKIKKFKKPGEYFYMGGAYGSINSAKKNGKKVSRNGFVPFGMCFMPLSR